MQLVPAILLAATASFIAYGTNNLSRGGALAATGLGTLVLGIGGWQWAAILLAFFLASSILSRVVPRAGKTPSEKYAKGNRRDAGQVLGNGGGAAIFLLAHSMFPESILPWLGFAAAVAAVNADTWATELGVLNDTPPRLITRLHQTVEAGTSGGVSLVGTISAALGSALIGILAAWLGGVAAMPVFVLVWVGGLLGALADSYLGATIQGMYRCTRDDVETEQHPLHRCGAPTVRIRGWDWLNNDWVNFGCGLLGALTSSGLGLAFALR